MAYSRSLTWMPLTEPTVPTGIKMGVNISPWSVVSFPARALVALSLYCKLKSIPLPPLLSKNAKIRFETKKQDAQPIGALWHFVESAKITIFGTNYHQHAASPSFHAGNHSPVPGFSQLAHSTLVSAEKGTTAGLLQGQHERFFI